MWQEVEFLDELEGIWREASDVATESVGDIGGVGEELLEVVFGGVVEALAGGVFEDRADVVGRVFVLLVLGEDLVLGWLEDVVESTQHSERKDDLAVVGRLIVVAQQIGDRPDEVG